MSRSRRILAVFGIVAALGAGAAACKPLPPNCHRAGTHGVVVCH